MTDKPTFLGFDLASGPDRHVEAVAQRIEGATYICTIPPALGRVTKIKMSGGKATVETESGIPMIVPMSTRR